ncbi:MAG: peptidylprolyl isomerase [Clostridia bacterium]|nr:peptidylprolyl isomerase [Clostridia bacterium]
MNIKRISGLLLAFSLLFSIGASAKTMEFTIGSSDLYVKDSVIEAKTIDAVPYIENSRTMVPVRVISENFGADVAWDEAARKVTIKSGETSVELTIDSAEAIVNGVSKTLDAPAIIKDGRTMIPLRFVGEALGKNVEYVDASRQILITDHPSAITVDGYGVSMDDVEVALKYITYVPGNVEESVLSALDYFTQVTPLANEAKKKGIYLNDSQKKELADSVMNDKDIYYSSTLTAPLIKILSDNLLARTYLDSLLEQYPIGDEAITDFYNQAYVRAKHILILTQDAQTGEELSKAEQTKAKKQIEDILKKLKNGEDFDALMKEYCQDPGIIQNPDGYVFTVGEMVPEFEKSAFELKEGEISDIVETSYGYHILKKEPLPEISEYIKMLIENNIKTELSNRIVKGLTDGADIKLVTPIENMIEEFSYIG